jgi:hypothetical protein
VKWEDNRKMVESCGSAMVLHEVMFLVDSVQWTLVDRLCWTILCVRQLIHLFVPTEAVFQSQVSACGMCGGQSGIGIGSPYII